MIELTIGDAKMMVVEAGLDKGLRVSIESLVQEPDEEEGLRPDSIQIAREYDGYDFKGTAIRIEDGVEVPIDAHAFCDCEHCWHLDATVWDRSPSPESLEHRERVSRQRRWGPFSYIPDRWSLWKWWLLALTELVDGILNIPLALFACNCSLNYTTVFWLARLDARRAARDASDDREGDDDDPA